MWVGRQDRGDLVACFDATATDVFATLCRLTAGDARRATALLIETYTDLRHTAAATAGVEVDRAWMVSAARGVYAAATDHDAVDGDQGPVGSLSPDQRVMLDLIEIEGRSVRHTAEVLGITADEADAMRSIAARRLSAASYGAPVVEVMRRGEVWFDDGARAVARAAIGGTADAAHVPPTSARASRPAAKTAEPRRRSRAAMLAAGVVAAALIGALAIWTAPDNTDQRATGTNATDRSGRGTSATPAATEPAAITEPAATTDPAPSMPTPTTTVTVDATTGAVIPATGDTGATPKLLPLTGYMIDPVPAGFTPSGAYLDQSTDSSERASMLEVWASVGATHSTGRWFAVITNSDDGFGFFDSASMWRRTRVGGLRALQQIDADGVRHLSIDQVGTGPLEFASLGFSDADLDALLGGMTSTTTRISYGPAAAAQFDELGLLVSHPTAMTSWRNGPPTVSSTYYRGSESREGISISVGPQSENDLEVTRLLQPTGSSDPAVAPLLAADGTIMIAGRRALIGAFGEGERWQFAMWHDGADTVTVQGSSITQLLEIAGSIRRATSAEWTELSHIQNGSSTTYNFVDPAMADIGDVTTTSGQTWTIGLSDQPSYSPSLVAGAGSFAATEKYPPVAEAPTDATDQSNGFNMEISPDPARPLRQWTTMDATLLAYISATAPAGNVLRISVAGSAPVDVPIVPVGAWFGAAYAFSEIAPYTAVLVDSTGQVVGFLTP